jgi:hypothetical protein
MAQNDARLAPSNRTSRSSGAPERWVYPCHTVDLQHNAFLHTAFLHPPFQSAAVAAKSLPGIMFSPARYPSAVCAATADRQPMLHVQQLNHSTSARKKVPEDVPDCASTPLSVSQSVYCRRGGFGGGPAHSMLPWRCYTARGQVSTSGAPTSAVHDAVLSDSPPDAYPAPRRDEKLWSRCILVREMATETIGTGRMPSLLHMPALARNSNHTAGTAKLGHACHDREGEKGGRKREQGEGGRGEGLCKFLPSSHNPITHASIVRRGATWVSFSRPGFCPE